MPRTYINADWLDDAEEDAEVTELRHQVRAERKHQGLLARHPDCRDPDHPMCPKCTDSEETGEEDDE